MAKNDLPFGAVPTEAPAREAVSRNADLIELIIKSYEEGTAYAVPVESLASTVESAISRVRNASTQIENVGVSVRDLGDGTLRVEGKAKRVRTE